MRWSTAFEQAPVCQFAGESWNEWEARHRIDDFPLGEHDTPDRLLIPEKRYGRRREVEILLASFNRIVSGGAPELVLS